MAQNVKIVRIVPLPHARSDVWQYFGFIADDDGEIKDKKKAICKICANTLAYSGNTTNLFTHLKAMHPEAQPVKLAPTNKTPKIGRKPGKRSFFELDDGSYDTSNTVTIGSGSSQPTYIIRAITYTNNESGSSTASLYDNVGDCSTTTTGVSSETSANSTSLLGVSNVKPISASSNVITNDEIGTPTSSTAPNITSSENVPLLSCDDITNAIVNMIVEDCRPICITQGRGFEELMRLLVPGYKIPTPEEFKPLIKRRHKELQRDFILRGFEDELME